MAPDCCMKYWYVSGHDYFVYYSSTLFQFKQFKYSDVYIQIQRQKFFLNKYIIDICQENAMVDNILKGWPIISCEQI
jgi:hypothetical protein